MEILRKLTFLVSIIVLCTAQKEYSYSDVQVKAAYIYNFISFITWPPKSGEIICIVGDDMVGMALPNVMNKEASLLRVEKRFYNSDMMDCKIVYIGSDEINYVEHILKSLHGKHVLTISGTENFLDKGGMVEFDEIDDKLKFSINKKALRKAHLEASALLYEVAYKVRGND